MRFILLLPCLAWACTNTSTLIDESYLACQLHPRCSDAFYLTPSHHFWEKARFNVLIGIVLDQLLINPTTICASVESFTIWIELLGSWRFCKENEVYSEKHGDCLCNPDKNCDDTMFGVLGGSATMEWIILLLLTLIFIYWSKHIYAQLLMLHQPKPTTPLNQFVSK
jgi:hypothetical protein